MSATDTEDWQEAHINWAQDIVDIYSNSWGPTDDGNRLEGPGYELYFIQIFFIQFFLIYFLFFQGRSLLLRLSTLLLMDEMAKAQSMYLQAVTDVLVATIVITTDGFDTLHTVCLSLSSQFFIV